MLLVILNFFWELKLVIPQPFLVIAHVLIFQVFELLGTITNPIANCTADDYTISLGGSSIELTCNSVTGHTGNTPLDVQFNINSTQILDPNNVQLVYYVTPSAFGTFNWCGSSLLYKPKSFYLFSILEIIIKEVYKYIEAVCLFYLL